jgi:hypothetical protein
VTPTGQVEPRLTANEIWVSTGKLPELVADPLGVAALATSVTVIDGLKVAGAGVTVDGTGLAVQE